MVRQALSGFGDTRGDSGNMRTCDKFHSISIYMIILLQAQNNRKNCLAVGKDILDLSLAMAFATWRGDFGIFFWELIFTATQDSTQHAQPLFTEDYLSKSLEIYGNLWDKVVDGYGFSGNTAPMKLNAHFVIFVSHLCHSHRTVVLAWPTAATTNNFEESGRSSTVECSAF